MADLITVEDITAAADAIAGHVLRTPSVASPGLAAHLGVPVSLKLEMLQRTGSFKPRGAFRKLLGLSAAERSAGVVAVSGGNHGLAVADAAGELGIAATIVMPESVPARAVEQCRASGATVRLTPEMAGAFALLDELVAAGATLVHPFDDRTVLTAQGTVGAEFAADAPGLTDVLVSIGGGALISGVATALGGRDSRVRVWGVETEGADSMSRAIAAGAPVRFEPTSVVTTLSAPYVTDLTLAHVRALVEDVLVVSDADAVRGALTLAEQSKVWAEPAAGCLVAAAYRVLDRVGPDAHLGLVLCGGNSTVADLASWTDRFAATPLPPREPSHTR
ncbi:pyridoxal-phosphate dependent enzyme [Pseudonocardia sp.]|uniref:threonine ammonia-lyase n=1 Tax=Pseudonocardia sp. TaxID=60912 RepID=UPI00261F83B6|nr:pyridoxal-phosphate dependent enzyme [Pseudonocardia sp.]